MHLLLAADDSEIQLISELAESFPGMITQPVHAGVVKADFPIVPAERLPQWAFARQLLPDAHPLRAESVRAWANELFPLLVAGLPDGKPWRLHFEPHYSVATVPRMGARAWHTASRLRSKATPGQPAGDSIPVAISRPAASGTNPGRHRCQLIRGALIELMRQKRRHLLRQLRERDTPFAPDESLVQVLLTSPESGWVSVAIAPLPKEQPHCLSPFPKGEVPVASDLRAPSRAFAKLVEAETRLGEAIRAGDRCVDLGAAPGSWTYVAVQRGAQVLAVDRSSVREDLMSHPRVTFKPGDGFKFQPEQRVDWLLCDMIAPASRSAALLLDWLRRRWCRRFVVTLKLKDSEDAEVLKQLKINLPALSRDWQLVRLCANKKELCAFGQANE